MQILMAHGGLADTNCYLVADETTGDAVLFDAPDGVTAPLLDHLRRQGWTLRGLWLTHGHFDHIADHAAVTRHCPGVPVLLHRLDESKLTGAWRNPFPLPFVIPPRRPDAFLEEGQRLTIGSLEVQVIHTPGHAPGHVSFHLPGEQTLIGGDLIICGGVGRTDLPDSDHRELCRSIARIMELPMRTRLLPGHGEASTLAQEQRHNTMVQEALRTSR